MANSSSDTIPMLDHDNYHDWSVKVIATVMKKANVNVMLGDVLQPTLAQDNANADEVRQWQRDDQTSAGIILLSLSPEARIHCTNIHSGSVMWTQLKQAYHKTTSASRMQHLTPLLFGTQAPDESVSALLARLSEYYNAFVASQPSGFEIAELNEEIFCWAVIRQLDPTRFDTLRNTLVQEQKMTKSRIITLATVHESGAKVISSSDSALAARSSVTPTTHAPPVSNPCSWCMSLSRPDAAKSHSLDQCHKLNRVLREQKQKASTAARPQQQQQQAAHATNEEFAGTASSIHSLSTTPADTFWIPDSGATSNMTSHKEWISEYIPLRVPIRLGDNSVVFSEGVGKVWFEPLLYGRLAPLVFFSRVLHVPRLKSNLLSVTYLSSQQKVKVSFIETRILFDKDTLLFMGTINANRVGMLIGRTLPAMDVPASALSATFYPLDIELWHRRFGHRSTPAVQRAIQHSVQGVTLDSSSKTPSPSLCVPCLAGKQHRDPFPAAEHRATRPLEIIYCDLRGPFPVRTRHHEIYWAIFTDLYTKIRYLALLKSKRPDELLTHYKTFVALGKARLGEHTSVITFRCDGGGEFLGSFKKYLISQGTQYQQTTRDTPQQNGISERANRDIGEGVVTALAQSGLPDTFWGEAATAFVHITNRFPTARLGDKTPYEMWHGDKPDVSHLRVWGCKAYVHIQGDQRTKTQPHTRECAFIGYPEDHKAWSFWDPKAKKVIISRDVVWDETSFLYPPRVGAPIVPAPSTTGTSPGTVTFIDPGDDDDPPEDGAPIVPHPINPPALIAPPIPHDSPLPALPAPLPVTPPQQPLPLPPPDAPRRSNRPRFAPKEFWRADAPLIPHPALGPAVPPSLSPTPSASIELHPPLDHGEDSDESEDPLMLKQMQELEQGLLAYAGIEDDGVKFSFNEALEYLMAANTTNDSPTYKEAMKSTDRDKWVAACLDEMRSHVENGSWKWVELPDGTVPVGSRWVLKIKRTEDGSIERYKARLVAQGFSQRPGFDFIENFAPTIRLSVIRAIFALVAAEDMECDALDITTAFLNGELEEAIYMKPPPGHEQFTPDGKRLYCLLLKAIYGLKQGSRQWYLKLSQVMKQLGFKKVRSEPCVYVYERQNDRVIVPSYVDDLHIASKSTASQQRVKDDLSKHFKLRDLGPSKWFLGIHITRDRPNKTLRLSQRQYCIDMLEEFGMDECKPVATPMTAGVRLSRDMCPQSPTDVEFMKDKPYMRAVGKLIWLALATRPDLAYTVSQLARFNANPGPKHWEAIKRVFRYIKGTLDHSLVYDSSSHPCNFVTYSDADHAGCPDTAKSTGGYVVLMGGGAVSWSSKLQTRVARSSTESEYMAAESASREMAFFKHVFSDFGFTISLPRPLAMDNQSAIAAARNPEHQGRMKHMNPIYHALRESVELEEVSPYYVSTSQMVADILTKPLDRAKVVAGCTMLGLHSVSVDG
jgi:hypothetical protein